MDEQKELPLWQDAIRHMVALFIICIGLLIGLYSAHWTTTVHHAYPATVYENGIPIRSTQVQLDGRYWGYLMDEDTFSGTFSVEELGKAGPYHQNARIQWATSEDIARLCFCRGVEPVYYTVPKMLMNRRMDEVAIWLWDGRVVATSDEMRETLETSYAHLFLQGLEDADWYHDEKAETCYRAALQSKYEKDPMAFYECLSCLPQRNQYKALSHFVPDMVEQGEWDAVQESLAPDQPINDSDALSGVMSTVSEVVHFARSQME